MSSSTLIGVWANGLWSDLGSPDCLNPLTISGYALQPNVLGTLNSRLQTCYQASGASGNGTIDFDVTPELTNSELSIIDSMYRISYYNNMAMSMMGQTAGDVPFVTIREGDSSITRANPVNIGKEYREMAKDERANLTYLINAYVTYVQNSSSPRSVDFLNPRPYLAYSYQSSRTV